MLPGLSSHIHRMPAIEPEHCRPSFSLHNAYETLYSYVKFRCKVTKKTLFGQIIVDVIHYILSFYVDLPSIINIY